jgi:hypothetical protein
MMPRSAVLAAATTGLIVALSACSGTATPPVPAPSSEVAPTPVVVTAGPPPPPGATGKPVIGVSTLPPVLVGEPAPFGDGLIANVVRIDQLQLEAHGPGEIAGPGVGVTVELKNESANPIDLGGIAVNASYRNGVPASASETAPAAAAAGALPPGETRRGVYVFQVPREDVGSLVVEVNYNGSPNVVLIRH